MADTILGIHSNLTGANDDFTAGHAWLSVSRAGVVQVYGLWPDAHPRTVDNGDATDIRRGLEGGAVAAASRYYKLSDAQDRHFQALLKANVAWRYTNTCASWASEVVDSVIGEDVDADDLMGFETPRELGRNILRLEASDPTSVISPKRVTKTPKSSSF